MDDMLTNQQIRTAIHRNEFVFHYQPKVSLVTGRVAGAEALIRWQQGDGTLVSPSEFIPVAAASPLITAITSHMFSRLLSDLSTFDGGGNPGGAVSINVSARDLQDDTLVTTMVEALHHAGIHSDEIELEVTENDALIGGERLMQNLRLLQDAGISLAMDDYGIGYSSIDSLSVWPFSTIKLDQGLIGRMLASKKNARIVQSSIRMAHELNMNVVAEGVESPEQYDFLMDSGCQMVQGYLISKPLPLDEFAEFVRGESRWRGFPMGLVQMAIIDHLQWRRQLVRRLIDNAQLPADSLRRLDDDYPEQSLTECSLGKWYCGEGTAFRDHPVFQAFDAPHRQLHKLTARLIKQVQEGAGLADITPELQAVTACSVELVGLLEALEDYGITQLRLQC
jgi:EAL domain-containing protein (putative c-di-GMP-specific phosphodiesterase class I)